MMTEKAETAELPTIVELPSSFAGLQPRVQEYRRFRICGGTLRADWAASAAKRGEPVWCEIGVWLGRTNEWGVEVPPHVGSYGGTVWPSAWPELFREVNRGHHGTSTYFTEAGLAAFGAVASLTVQP